MENPTESSSDPKTALLSNNTESEIKNEISKDFSKDNSSSDNIENDESKERIILSRSFRKIIFVLIELVCILSNADGGIIPAANTQIQEDMDILSGDFGLYSSIDYFGRLIGSIVFVGIINKTNRRFILIGTLIFKALTLLIPIFTHNFLINLIARGCSGFSQVYYTIYPAVWCDQYGPRDSKTIMIALVQAGLPLGIVIGYGIDVLLNEWGICFCIEGAILGGLALILFFMPQIYFSNSLVLVPDNDLIGIRSKKESMNNLERGINESITSNDSNNNTNNSALSNQPSYFEEKQKEEEKNYLLQILSNLGAMLTEPVFIFTGLSNSISFFGMAVVQYWSPNYLEKVIKLDDAGQRFIIFAVVCVTSPPIGILLGGFIGGKIGGYTNKKSILACLGSVIIYCLVASVCSQLNNAWLFALDLWLYLFFSSAVIPLETGIIINSLPANLRGDGFSVMNFLLNLTGNLPASYVYGLIDEHSSSDRLAMTVCMLYNWFSLITLGIAAIFRYKKKDEEEEIEETQEKKGIIGEEKKEEEKKEEDKNKDKLFDSQNTSEAEIKEEEGKEEIKEEA